MIFLTFFDAQALIVPKLILKRFGKSLRAARAPTDSAVQSHVSSETWLLNGGAPFILPYVGRLMLCLPSS
jgi:hypothetical protein